MKGFKNLTELLAALLGAIVGGTVTFFGESVYRNREDKGKQQHSASILYNDLKSIQSYLLDESLDVVNIRYTTEWQRYVADCVFLTTHEVSILYEIYDRVYYFSQVFDEFLLSVEEQPDVTMRKELSEKINHQNFKEMMDILKNVADKKSKMNGRV